MKYFQLTILFCRWDNFKRESMKSGLEMTEIPWKGGPLGLTGGQVVEDLRRDDRSFAKTPSLSHWKFSEFNP